MTLSLHITHYVNSWLINHLKYSKNVSTIMCETASKWMASVEMQINKEIYYFNYIFDQFK